jgi:hypothetical protein
MERWERVDPKPPACRRTGVEEDNAIARCLYDSYVSADGFVRYALAFDGAVATAG